jgi:hypothetical protein
LTAAQTGAFATIHYCVVAASNLTAPCDRGARIRAEPSKTNGRDMKSQPFGHLKDYGALVTTRAACAVPR